MIGGKGLDGRVDAKLFQDAVGYLVKLDVGAVIAVEAVSYTHLDVYKRQPFSSALRASYKSLGFGL